MSDSKKLFLLDAMALIYRAHYAFINNPRVNSKGLNTSSAFGFTNSLLEIIEKEKPTHIGVAFDSHGPTVRHEQFTEYKANREKQPEDITIALPIIKTLLNAFKIPVIELAGYEADDIIGTLATKAANEGFEVFMYTPDKDFAQLVKDKVYLYKPAKMGNPPEMWNTARVLEYFGIKRTEQVIEIQGLMGDSVDNIPGVPGIGPKGAQKLIEEFDTIDNLIKNTDKLKDKQKILIETYADQALLSRELARIIVDLPIDFKEEEFKLESPDKDFLEQLLVELEFRNLGKKLLGKEIQRNDSYKDHETIVDLFGATEEKPPTPVPENIISNRNYQTLEDKPSRTAFIDKIKSSSAFSFNLDVSGQNPFDARILSISFSLKPEEACYIKLPIDRTETETILLEFKSLFEDERLLKIGYNIKFSILLLNQNNIKIRGELFDVMIADYLSDPEINHNFDTLVSKYLNTTLVSTGNLSTTTGFSISACEKADYIYRIKNSQEPLLKENNYQRLFYEIEMPLIYVLSDMEITGVNIDQDVLKDYSVELSKEIALIEDEVFRMSGVSFNINSPLQLGKVLFDILKIDPSAKKTRKSKQYATGEEVLVKLAHKSEIVQKILDYREIQKLKSTYVDALPVLINPKTGRVHTSFNQAVTATGRLSSTNPNMQNIPIRTDKGRYIRKAFIPKNKDNIILSADYSQIELRVIAHISKDPTMIEAFLQNEDIHNSTASKIYNISLSEVTPEMRRKAKVVNFGIIYGISGWGLAERLGIARKEGENLITQYFQKFPGIKTYMNDTIAFAQTYSYVQTLMGRKRYIRDINSSNSVQRGFAERNAINAPIQGTAADMIKIAMVNIHNAFIENKINSQMILQVHDELVFDVIKDEETIVKQLVKEKMENAITLSVPIIVELGTGIDWFEAH